MLGRVVELLSSRCCVCCAYDSVCSAVVDVDENPIIPSGINVYITKRQNRPRPVRLGTSLRSSMDVCVRESTFRQAEVVSEQRGWLLVGQSEGKPTRTTYQSLDLLSPIVSKNSSIWFYASVCYLSFLLFHERMSPTEAGAGFRLV